MSDQWDGDLVRRVAEKDTELAEPALDQLSMLPQAPAYSVPEFLAGLRELHRLLATGDQVNIKRGISKYAEITNAAANWIDGQYKQDAEKMRNYK